MATRSSNHTNDNPAVSQVAGELNTTLSSADSSVNQVMQSLETVRRARLSQLSRSAATLQQQYGADDPIVKAAQAAAAAARMTAARLSIVRQQLAAPAVPVEKNGWALQGRVFDAQFAPAAKFTVFLVDANKNYLRQYGFAYTDSTGYFLLSYSGSAEQQEAAAEMFIEIANTEAKPVYLSSTAFEPTLGTATYQNIVLPAGGEPIGDPPEEIRTGAAPAGKPKTKARVTPKKP